ncbi:MAG TPA: nucleoside triphosphate pyrophosphatase [Anaerolineales bacterium]
MLTLASASPRRQALLRLTGWELVSRPAEVDERPEPGESPEQLTQRLAIGKARTAAGELVLGADTVVVLENDMLGKPAGSVAARDMLQALRGRTHRVISSIALVDRAGRTVALDTCVSEVPMREYSEADVDQYLRSGSPLDKAGGYGIQDGEFNPVNMDQMHDCFANVMGLPLCHLVRNMRRLGHEPPADVPEACQAYTGYDCPVYPAILRGEQ